jgi:3-phosphoshikimate 1-carboxyvinyltransferase
MHETAIARPLAARAPARPLSGEAPVPGDKSISHRALMFGALAVGVTEITGLLEGEDVLRTAAAMRALGAEVADLGGGRWRVAGRGIGGLVEPEDVLDMGNSGTAARLLCGLLAGHPIFSVMTGDASLRKRPMKRVTEPLSATGARFAMREGGRLPLAVEGAADALPLDYRVPVPSAQVKSACLLAGLCARGVTRVIEAEATRDHTENMLRHFGATVAVSPEGHGRVVELTGQPELVAAPVAVPGDPSSAAFPAVAALLVPGSEVMLRGVGMNPLRAGLFATLAEMGAGIARLNERVEGGEPVADLRIRASALRAVDVPAERAPLRHPLTVIGSDGLPNDPRPHPRLWGAFPRVLGYWARERQVFPLQHAIHKMTGQTAERFRLHDRGVLREGAFADLVLFDPEQIHDQATFAEPERQATGIAGVWVNGVRSFNDGSPSGRRAGRFLSRMAPRPLPQ